VGWSPKPYEGIKLVDVTSSQSAASIRRRNFSPMTEIEGGYKGFYNFEHYWQSGKVFKGISEEITKQWWKKQQTPARRYPGAKGLTVLYSSWPDETPYHAANEHMDWVTSRKKVYVPEYTELVKNRPSTVELQQWVNAGNDVIFYDYDGPKEDGRPITLEITPDMLRAKINDVRAPFGHGYVVGALVKGIPLEAYLLA